MAAAHHVTHAFKNIMRLRGMVVETLYKGLGIDDLMPLDQFFLVMSAPNSKEYKELEQKMGGKEVFFGKKQKYEKFLYMLEYGPNVKTHGQYYTGGEDSFIAQRFVLFRGAFLQEETYREVVAFFNADYAKQRNAFKEKKAKDLERGKKLKKKKGGGNECIVPDEESYEDFFFRPYINHNKLVAIFSAWAGTLEGGRVLASILRRARLPPGDPAFIQTKDILKEIGTLRLCYILRGQIVNHLFSSKKGVTVEDARELIGEDILEDSFLRSHTAKMVGKKPHAKDTLPKNLMELVDRAKKMNMLRRTWASSGEEIDENRQKWLTARTLRVSRPAVSASIRQLLPDKVREEPGFPTAAHIAAARAMLQGKEVLLDDMRAVSYKAQYLKVWFHYTKDGANLIDMDDLFNRHTGVQLLAEGPPLQESEPTALWDISFFNFGAPRGDGNEDWDEEEFDFKEAVALIKNSLGMFVVDLL